MISQIDKSKCYSCGICSLKCPKGCISVEPDERGVFYPHINEDLCVQCNICSDICPVNNAENLKNPSAETCFSLISTIPEIKKAASSGGAFLSLVNSHFLKDNAKVYGAVYSNNRVYHTGYDNIDDCYAFSKSKYIKSDCSGIFNQLKNELEDGMNILFSGTPCQVASLKLYLKKNYNNLTTVDFVCGGCPTQKFFDDYINSFDKKVKDVIFRYEHSGNKRNIFISFEDGSDIIQSVDKDLYFQAFANNLTQMEACFNCDFCDSKRCSDITLGDFWGIEKVEPDLNASQGISLILINTEKGKALFDAACDIKCKEYPIDIAVSGNPRLKTNLVKSKYFSSFNDDVNKKGFQKAVENILKKTYKIPFSLRIKNKIKNILVK